LVVWGCIVKAQRSGENDYRSLEAAKRPASDRFFTAELKKPSAAATDNQDLPKYFFSKLGMLMYAENRLSQSNPALS